MEETLITPSVEILNLADAKLLLKPKSSSVEPDDIDRGERILLTSNSNKGLGRRLVR